MNDCLQTRTADAVHRFRGDFLRNAGLQRRLTRNVHSRTGLQDAAHDDVAEIGRLDVGASNRFADNDGAEIDCGQIFESAAKGTDRRAARTENDCGFVIGHIGEVRL